MFMEVMEQLSLARRFRRSLITSNFSIDTYPLQAYSAISELENEIQN